MSSAATRLRTILQIHPGAEALRASWTENAGNLGLTFLRTPRWSEAQSYYRAYPLLAVLVQIDSCDEALLKDIAELRRIPPEVSVPPLVGLAAPDVSAEQRILLADYGLDLIFSQGRSSPVSQPLFRSPAPPRRAQAL
jgi:hypothetical protein